MMILNRHFFQLYICVSLLSFPLTCMADASKPYSAPAPTPLPPRKEEPVRPYKPAPRQSQLPLMTKPFGMPGVIGFQNDKWEGNDYLGYLTRDLAISVEILKTENVPQVPDASVIENLAAELFRKEGLNPQSSVTEGPPLPFLHILVIVYPTDADRYVIFCNVRLFEHIQVIRKDFVPAGYWQGITWENQDMTLSSSQKIGEKIKELSQKQVMAFILRYKQYNLPAQEAPALPQRY